MRCRDCNSNATSSLCPSIHEPDAKTGMPLHLLQPKQGLERGFVSPQATDPPRLDERSEAGRLSCAV